MSVPIFQLKKEEMQGRIKSLQTLLSKEHLDACVLEQPDDLFYFTGLHLSYGRLWVHKKKTSLFVDSRYIEVAMKDSFVQPVVLFNEEKEKAFVNSLGPAKIAFDGTTLSYSRFAELSKFLEKCGNSSSLIPKERLTSPIRMIKGMFEIKELKASANILKSAFWFLRGKIKVGMTEVELAREFEIFLRLAGAERAAFEPIIAFGKNSAMPHHRAGKTKLKENQIVLMDLGVVVNHYHSDMTRVFFQGVPDPILLYLTSVLKKAHTAARLLCKPGVRLGQLDEAVREVMRKDNMEQYFTHSLGHGIGLETHEAPKVRFDSIDKDLLLEPGMMFTIEPGLYLPGKGGVRWEDMVLITKNGCQIITDGK